LADISVYFCVFHFFDAAATGQAMQKTLSSFLRLVGEFPKPFEITLRVAARFYETLGLPPAQYPENKKKTGAGHR